MAEVVILTEAELRQLVHLDEDAIAVVEQAFEALATKAVAMPPILRLDIPEHNGEVDVKTAYVPGIESFAIKVSPGFFDNPKLGLPSLNGLMVVFSATTGLAEALLLDNGYLTAVRTAAAGAVAAKYLAPEEVATAGVLGAGEQARLQILAAHLVRPFKEVLVWARDGDKAARCAVDLAATLGIEAKPLADAAELVKRSQLVVTTTPATQPILLAEWLHPGLHVTAMGSDSEHKNEVEGAALAAADLYVCDRRSQVERLGELHHALEAGVVGVDFRAAEIGEVIAGKVPGRRSAKDITICDLTGTGVQDTAIAAFARARAAEAGAGRRIAT